MRFSLPSLVPVYMLMSATVLGGCSSESSAIPEELTSSISYEEVSVPELVVLPLARALQDESHREIFFRTLSSSRISEGKVHLGSFLRTEGALLLADMQRFTMLPNSDVILNMADSLETYLPVPAHRESWAGDEEVIVATQVNEDDTPFGVFLDGMSTELSLETPPSTPVIAVVPRESFDEHGEPYETHTQVQVDEKSPLTAGEYGLWITSVNTVKDFEPWIKGSPEFELHMDYEDLAKNPPRVKISCVRQDSVPPYKWDMNGTSYSTPFMLTSPLGGPNGNYTNGKPIVVYMYEDDDTPCVIKDKDYVGLAVKAMKGVGALAGIQSSNGNVWLDVYNGLLAAWDIILTGDDFVGVGSTLQVNGQIYDIQSAPVKMTLKNAAANPQGTIWLHWDWH